MEPPPTPDHPPPLEGSELDRILAGYLVRMQEFQDDALEALCRSHPEDADAIRERFRGRPITGTESFEPLASYQPLKVIGRGGQGVVYLAVDHRLKRSVALKVLRGFAATSDAVLGRFVREAEVASRLDHPGICPVYDAGVEGEVAYIAMRYLPGRTLAEVLDAARAREPSDREPEGDGLSSRSRSGVRHAVKLIEQTARSLHAAHEAGIVHRDVKPGNIMISSGGDPVLMDFGLAGEETARAGLTRTGDFLGTPAYMSPEQSMRRRLDRRTDVFSLGVTLYECLTLRRPFDSPTRASLCRAIQHEDPPDPGRTNPHVSSDLRVVLEKAMEKDPEHRYGSALELAEDLRRFLAGEPILARSAGPFGRLSRFVKRRPAQTAFAGAILLGLALAVAMAGFIAAKAPEIARQKRQEVERRVEGFLQQGYAALNDFRLERARDAFEAALGLDDATPEAVAGLAMVFVEQKQNEAGLALLDAHGSLAARVPGLVRLRMRALEALGRRAEARALGGGLPEARTALDFFLEGRHHNRRHVDTGDPKALALAVACYERAVVTARRARPLYHGEFAAAIRTTRDIQSIREAVETLTSLWPDHAYTWTCAGCALADVDAEAALQAFDRAIALNPRDAMAHGNRGSVLHVLGRTEEALAASRRAIAIDPDSRFYPNVVAHLLKLGRVDEALAAAQEGVKRNPRFASAQSHLAIAWIEKGDLEKALAAHRAAVALSPRSPETLTDLGDTLLVAGRLDEARATYERILAFAPDHPGAHRGIGLVHKAAGRMDDCIRSLRHALELDLRKAYLHVDLGDALLAAGRLDAALDAFEEAAALAPDHVVPHARQGEVLCRQHRPDLAIPPLRRALELAPEDGFHCMNLGCALAQCGRLDEARRHLERARELDPTLIDAHRFLATVDFELGRYAAALRAARDGLAAALAKKTWESEARHWVEQLEQNAEAKALEAMRTGFRALARGDSGDARAARTEALAWLQELVRGWAMEGAERDPDPDAIRSRSERLRRRLERLRGAPLFARLPEAERRGWIDLLGSMEAIGRGREEHR